MPNVFISYRRSDRTSGYASWIYDRLAAAFGPEHVFMDVDSMPLGVDFVEHLERVLSSADIALVLIGPAWLDARDENGTRRLDDPDDFVRMEIAVALRADVRVIPVLVEDADMPERRQLPDDLQPLARRHALKFQREGGVAIRALISTIEELAGSGAPTKEVIAAKEPTPATREYEVPPDELPPAPPGFRIIIHPNLIPIYEMGEYEGGLFVAMQLIEGEFCGRSAGRRRSSSPGEPPTCWPRWQMPSTRPTPRA